MVRRFVFLFVLPAACGVTPDEASCAAICQKAAPPASESAVKLSAFEEQLLAPVIEDVRKGVRPFDDKSVGICPKAENSRQCDQMLGVSPGELPAGEYILYGNFQVPDVGERGTWTVRLETDCKTTRGAGDSGTSSAWSKDYEVVYVGKDRGYVLAPMRRITSPNPTGAQSCTYKLLLKQPAGDQVIEGAWSVPDGSTVAPP
jgi:hypothetical protein